MVNMRPDIHRDKKNAGAPPPDAGGNRKQDTQRQNMTKHHHTPRHQNKKIWNHLKRQPQRKRRQIQECLAEIPFKVSGCLPDSIGGLCPWFLFRIHPAPHLAAKNLWKTRHKAHTPCVCGSQANRRNRADERKLGHTLTRTGTGAHFAVLQHDARTIARDEDARRLVGPGNGREEPGGRNLEIVDAFQHDVVARIEQHASHVLRRGGWGGYEMGG